MYLGLIRVFVFILLNIERKCALDFFGGTGGAIEEDEEVPREEGKFTVVRKVFSEANEEERAALAKEMGFVLPQQ